VFPPENPAGNVGSRRDNECVTAGIAQDAASDQVVRIRLLGQFAITAGSHAATSWPRPTARRLCELVLVSPGRRISRDLACDELFPRLEPRTAARSLSKALSMARGALAGLGEPGAALLAADLGHIWVAGSVEVDAEAHAAALRAGLAMAPGTDRDETLATALAEDGELLADEPYADWAAGPRERLDALRQEARLALARDRAMGSGRSGRGDVLAAWQSCLDHDPACEEAAGALVRGYFAQGRPELAARVFERCRAALEQLGLRISPSLEQVYAVATREHNVTAASPANAPASPPAGRPQPPREASLSPTPHPQQLPREERRPVTVLFAEVAAPAGLAGAGALGLEALREVVGGSLAAVIAEVEALGGTVISVSGRGLEAMFGAPEAHEDDPERALRASFRALATTAAAADGGPALRIGVETGPAVVGPIGGGAKVEYGAFGDVVSVAAALQSSARPGSVLVGPSTRAVTGHLFSWGAAEEVALSGHPRPLVASYLDAPRARVAQRRPRLGGRATLVDRDAEMQALDGALRAAVTGHGCVVLLTAEPGLGKTRLVQECRKRFIAWVGAGSGRLPLWLEGRCASYASAVPYSLYRQLVASWIGISPDQPAQQLRPALETALVHLMGNANLLPPLARMMGAATGAERQAQGRTGPEELQRMTFGAVRSVVSRFAAAGPTVLVLEDLHWADPTSLRLTLELAELATGRPLLVLATTRPGAGPEVEALAARGQTRQLALRPLSAAAAAALASSLIGGQVARPEVFATVLATADGNPLFLEERLSSLLETRTLVREQGTWRLRRTQGPEVPQVLERLVRSRVDRLGPAAQEAIRAAAVLGTEFTAPLLAAVLDSQPAALAPVLAELSASDLVHREQATAAGDRYRFRHALLQEAVYLGLLRAERRGLHARAAAAVAAVSNGRLPEVAAVLGRHYAAAGNAGQAVRYFELAGDHATDAFANEEAIASFRAALAVTAWPAETDAMAARARAATAVRLRTRLANVLWRTGRREEARDEYRAALRLGDAVDPLLRAHLYTRLGRLELTSLSYEAATAAFDAAEALLGDHPGDGAADGDEDRAAAAADQWLEIMIDGRADIHVLRFEPDQALEVLEAARPVLEAHGTPARRYVFDRLYTQQRLIRNRFLVDDADIARLRRSLEMAEHTGEEKDLGYATHFLGWALWLHGDLPEARRQLQSASDMAERMGETFLRAVSLLWLTLTALRAHDTETARALLPRATAAAENAGAPLAGVMACRAWLAWQDGCPDDVLRLADELAHSELTTVGVVAVYDWVYLFPLIAARLGAGSVKEAVAAARRLLDPAQQALPGDVTAALSAAAVEWDRGEPDAARQHLESALRLARDRDYF
jgi:adenylate cyclase